MKLFAFFVACGLAMAAQAQTQGTAAASDSQTGPVFRVTVVSRNTKAINYHHRQGSTEVDFRGTDLMPDARGKAKVDSRTGATKVEVEFDHLQPARMFGPEFVTYVLWAITPEGRAQNMGEVYLDGTKSKLLASTELQAFGMIVTAEPYYAVTQPSDVVVMENFVGRDTTGTIEPIEVKYDLLARGSYTRGMMPNDVQRLAIQNSVPLDLVEARHAMEIAQIAGADRYAADTMARARVEMQNAEGFFSGKQKNTKKLQSVARQATQLAEDARLISLKKQEEEALANERAAAADREARAKAEAEKQNQERQAAEAESARLATQTAAAEQAQAAAERAKREADEAAQKASLEREQADAARQAALVQQQQLQGEADKSRLAAEEAERGRQQAENEKTQLRAQLLRQLNLILETRDTARGLIVNMSDVLFDSGKYSLRPAAREKLARISGIVLSHPGLKLAVEGHTDSIGSEEFNQRLSERRAESVQEYLVAQGLPPDAVTSHGFGKSMPVASNGTAAGRQQNRRVELVVSGEVIGTQFGGTAQAPQIPQAPSAP